MQDVPTPVRPAPTPLPAQAQGGAGAAVAQAPRADQLRPLTPQEREALREARSELSRQLTSAANRREELTEELRTMPQAAQSGVIARIELLDQRIIQLETDIAETGRMLTAGTTLPPPDPQLVFGMPEETFSDIATLSVLFVLTPLALAFARLLWKRGTKAARQPTEEQRANAERLERLEQAVDAIAIEVERVGESQRYQARVLSEANLMPPLPAAQVPMEPLRVPEATPLTVRPQES